MCCSSGPDKAELSTLGCPYVKPRPTTATTVADSASDARVRHHQLAPGPAAVMSASRAAEPVRQHGEIDEGDPDGPVAEAEREHQHPAVDHASAGVDDVGDVAVPLLGC